jgi:predicted kinase
VVYCHRDQRRRVCSTAIHFIEAVLLIGIQATGKSTFCRERFGNTHVRINLDTLKTRRREDALLSECLDARRPFIVDNTNVTSAERAKYISLARSRGFSVTGYYFESRIADALKRNAMRAGKECIPERGVLSAYAKLQLPTRNEGFEKLFYVQIGPNNTFVVEEWQDEV